MPALIQEAACAERVVVLKVRVPGRTSLIVIAKTGCGLLDAEVRRALWGGKLPAGALRQRSREDALEGAHVVALTDAEAFVDQRGDGRVIRPVNGRVVVTDGAPPPGAVRIDDLDDATRSTLEARGKAIAGAVAVEALDVHRADVLRLLERAAQKIARRREAIRGDLDKIGQADKIAAQAQWLVAEAARAPRGATKLVVTDWSTGEAVPLELPLDPAKSAKDQVTAMFKRAKRLRLGARVAEERLAATEAQVLAVEDARALVRVAASLPDIDRALQDAKKAAPRDVTLPGNAPSGTSATKSSKATKSTARVPYRAFFARSGRRLMAGKGAADNDALTLHVARPHDLWLHAKDRTGSHVIVPLDKGQTASAEDLVDAAHLAAHFSEARDEKVVDVQYTERRYLRKPKGSPPGLVIVDREKVLVLRVEPELLRGLLEREDV